MALTRTDIGLYKSTTEHGTASFATGSFTPPADSLLIITVNMVAKVTGDLGQPTISGGSLSYTYQGQARGEASYNHRINLFTAPVGSSPASMTITVDDDNNQNIAQYVVTVTAYTGYDTGTPIAGFVTSNTTDIGDGSETQTLAATPTADDVTLCAYASDTSGIANPSLGDGWTLIYDDGTDGYAITTMIRRESSTSTSVTITDVYTTGGTYWKGSMFSFIVKAAAAIVNTTGTQYFDSIALEAYVSGSWVNLWSDVIKDSVKWNMGIMDNSPTARVGDSEKLSFSLKNGSDNIGGLAGYYTPGHANCLSGWDTGINVRLVFTYESLPFYKYYGKILPSGITAAPFVLGERTVDVDCHGFMSQADDHPFELPTIQTNVKINEAVTALLTNMPIQPLTTSFATGVDTFPTMFDTVKSNTRASSEFQKMANSEFGYIYTRGDRTGGQTLVVESRSTRSALSNFIVPLNNNDAGFALNEDGGFALNEDGGFVLNDESETSDFSNLALMGMKAPSYGRNLSNQVKAVTVPRRVDAAATTVLFSTQERIPLAAGQTKTGFRGDYRDPAGGASYVNGKDMVTPVSGTDYIMGSTTTSSDLNASLTVTATYGTEAVEYDITNTGAALGYVYLQARGKGIYIYDEVEVVKKDTTSINKHGLYSISFDMKYQNNPAAGDAIANHILAYEKNPNRTVEDYPMLANTNGRSMYSFLYGEPGLRSAFSEAMNAINGNYFIMGYEAQIVDNKYVFWSPVLKRLEDTIAFEEHKIILNIPTTTSENTSEDLTFVIRIPASALSLPNGDVEQIRFIFDTQVTTGLILSSVYVGHAAASGDAYDFRETPVQILYAAGASFNLSTAGNKLSDWATFVYDKTADLLLAFRTDTATAGDNLRYKESVDTTGITSYRSITNEPAVVNKVGVYSTTPGILYAISLIETQGTQY